jgi:hypothetical protein
MPNMSNHSIPIIYHFMVILHKGASKFQQINTWDALLEQILAPKWSNTTISILKPVVIFRMEPTVWSENLAIQSYPKPFQHEQMVPSAVVR